MVKYKVLIVDDNKHFIDALKFMLMDVYGNNIDSIDCAMDGQECLNILNRKYIDVVFMDIDMPVMNGIEATKIATSTFRDLKIIALSFHTDMKYVIQMIEAGARNYIVKEEINKINIRNVMES